MDAFFAKDTPSNQRISNYSGVRSSVTEFNQNSVAVQGGAGFVDNPAVVFNHGPSVDVSDAFDVMTLWVQLYGHRSASPGEFRKPLRWQNGL